LVDPQSFRDRTSIFIKRMNSEIKKRCGEMSVPIADLYTAFGSGERKDLLDPDLAIGDNAHLNIDGQKRIADVLMREYFDDADEFQVVVCLGDSHTQGWPVRVDTSRNGHPVDISMDSPHQFPYWLARATGRTFINRGIAGNTFFGMVKRFDEEVVVHMPDHCILQGGTNDALLGTPFDESLNDLLDLIGHCIDNEIEPIVCTIIPLGF
jgi:lysophospholipase L1-like esterase